MLKFIPFLLLIIVACNSSQVEKTWDEKLFSLSNDVLLYQQKAFSGTLVKYYSNKKLASKQNFTEGKLEGLTEKWFENGLGEMTAFGFSWDIFESITPPTAF